MSAVSKPMRPEARPALAATIRRLRALLLENLRAEATTALRLDVEPDADDLAAPARLRARLRKEPLTEVRLERRLALEERLDAFLADLQAQAPRAGLGAATGAFVDHLVALTGRYGAHLFVCFDDARIPATTNDLEGFFGRAKRHVRQTLGSGDCTQAVVGNLGAAVLLAFADCQRPDALARIRAVTPEPAPFRDARARLAHEEAPATTRRSMVRHLDRHLDDLRQRWLHPPSQPPNA